MIVLPPSLPGAVQLTVACSPPALALTPVGAPGGFGTVGVTAFEGTDSWPAPAPLIAATLKVYVVPPVRPVTVAEAAGANTVVGVCAEEPM